jgi:hypothetical protein
VVAQNTGRYWKNTAGHLPDFTWSRNKQKLSELPNIGSLYDHLDLAFGHIRRINTGYAARILDSGVLHFVRLDRYLVRLDDDLAAAIMAINGAIGAVERQLEELG